jgi:hypothetical protein
MITAAQKNTPHDPQERLILAIQQVADDIIHLMTVPPHRVPTTDPAGQQIIGMFLVLGRLYWAITGTTFQTKDPKKILQWAHSLKKKEIIVL